MSRPQTITRLMRHVDLIEEGTEIVQRDPEVKLRLTYQVLIEHLDRLENQKVKKVSIFDSKV